MLPCNPSSRCCILFSFKANPVPHTKHGKPVLILDNTRSSAQPHVSCIEFDESSINLYGDSCTTVLRRVTRVPVREVNVMVANNYVVLLIFCHCTKSTGVFILLIIFRASLNRDLSQESRCEVVITTKS
jgi:hypothetical protein